MLEMDKARVLNGNESLRDKGKSIDEALGGATVTDFWRWGYSRLKADVIRGTLAEFIVARLLGSDLSDPGSPDREYDVLTRTGRTVEVKSSAYWQEWLTPKPNSPAFSGLKCKAYSRETGFALRADYQSDLFVFCVLGHGPTDPPRDALDPLDLSQWEFYVLSRADLLSCNPPPVVSPDRLSLYRVRLLTHACRWNELRGRVAEAERAYPPSTASG